MESIASTLTERRFFLDDGTAFDAMFLDTVHVTHEPVTDRPNRSEDREAGQNG
ncbi:hypothetical protein [Microbacterium resistens]|uniref:hypothetical protein n=1 Tax=Microbacterium resistens TaxID=156977 RepID=UPI003671A454